MNTILDVTDLVKVYPGFTLDHVSFSLEEGKITGFIGRNGAGKTTTLHSLLSLLTPDGGEIRFWGMDIREHEQEIKQRIGFVSAGMSFYTKQKLRKITAITRSFYDKARLREAVRRPPKDLLRLSSRSSCFILSVPSVCAPDPPSPAHRSADRGRRRSRLRG